MVDHETQSPMTGNRLPTDAPKDFGRAEDDDALSALAGEALSRGRLTILRILAEGPGRYTDVAGRTGGSESETSRHLHRLLDARLARRDSAGRFDASPLGLAVLRAVAPLRSLAARADFFSTHASDQLPREFLQRLDETDGASLATDPLQVMAAAESVFLGVSTHFYGQWVLGKPALSEGELLMQGRLRARILASKADARAILLPHEVDTLRAALPRLSSYFAVRTTPRSPIAVAVSDEGAVLQLNDASGRIDFHQALVGRDARFVRWCRELFLDTWSRTDPVGMSDASPM